MKLPVALTLWVLTYVTLFIVLLVSQWQVEEQRGRIGIQQVRIDYLERSLHSCIELESALRKALQTETCGKVSVEYR